MKSYRPDIEPDVLLELLCKYFRIDPRFVTYTERIEMFYIYHYISQRFNTDDDMIIFGEIEKLQAEYRMRSKRRRLYQVFFQCKAAAMAVSERYDTSASKVPINPVRGNYY